MELGLADMASHSPGSLSSKRRVVKDMKTFHCVLQEFLHLSSRVNSLTESMAHVGDVFLHFFVRNLRGGELQQAVESVSEGISQPYAGISPSTQEVGVNSEASCQLPPPLCRSAHGTHSVVASALSAVPNALEELQAMNLVKLTQLIDQTLKLYADFEKKWFCELSRIGLKASVYWNALQISKLSSHAVSQLVPSPLSPLPDSLSAPSCKIEEEEERRKQQTEQDRRRRGGGGGDSGGQHYGRETKEEDNNNDDDDNNNNRLLQQQRRRSDFFEEERRQEGVRLLEEEEECLLEISKSYFAIYKDTAVRMYLLRRLALGSTDSNILETQSPAIARQPLTPSSVSNHLPSEDDKKKCQSEELQEVKDSRNGCWTDRLVDFMEATGYLTDEMSYEYEEWSCSVNSCRSGRRRSEEEEEERLLVNSSHHRQSILLPKSIAQEGESNGPNNPRWGYAKGYEELRDEVGRKKWEGEEGGWKEEDEEEQEEDAQEQEEDEQEEEEEGGNSVIRLGDDVIRVCRRAQECLERFFSQQNVVSAKGRAGLESVQQKVAC